jgi:hypothetical protein
VNIKKKRKTKMADSGPGVTTSRPTPRLRERLSAIPGRRTGLLNSTMQRRLDKAKRKNPWTGLEENHFQFFQHEPYSGDSIIFELSAKCLEEYNTKSPQQDPSSTDLPFIHVIIVKELGDQTYNFAGLNSAITGSVKLEAGLCWTHTPVVIDNDFLSELKSKMLTPPGSVN